MLHYTLHLYPLSPLLPPPVYFSRGICLPMTVRVGSRNCLRLKGLPLQGRLPVRPRVAPFADSPLLLWWWPPLATARQCTPYMSRPFPVFFQGLGLGSSTTSSSTPSSTRAVPSLPPPVLPPTPGFTPAPIGLPGPAVILL